VSHSNYYFIYFRIRKLVRSPYTFVRSTYCFYRWWEIKRSAVVVSSNGAIFVPVFVKID